MKTLLLTRGPGLRRAVLLVLVAGVPAVFLRSLNDPFNVPKLAFLLVLVTVVGAVRVAELLQGESPERLRALLVPATALLAPLTVAWLASPFKGWELLGLYGRFGGLIPYVLVVVAGILIADAFSGDALPLAWAVVAGGVIASAYAIIQWLGADPYSWSLGGQETRGVATSTLGNSNFTGGYLSVVLPVALGLCFLDRTTRRRALKIVPVVAIGWLLSFSQGALAAGLASLAVTGGFVLAPRWRNARLAGLAVAAAGLIVVVGAVGYTLIEPETTRLPITVTYRGWWWQSAVSMALDSPIFGSGPNTFALKGVQYRPAPDALEINYNFADDPHSVFFAMLANAGVLGAAGFLVVVGWTVRKGVSLAAADILPASFFGSAIAYFVQAMVSIDELSLRLSLWVALGGVVASTAPRLKEAATGGARGRVTKKKKRRAARSPLRRPAAVYALALPVAAASWWGIGFVMADGRVLEGKRLFAQDRPEEAIERFQLALGFRDSTRYRQDYGFHLGQVALARGVEGEDYLARARDAFGYLDGFPELIGRVSLARILRNYSVVDPATGEEAIDLYEEARRIDPLNPLLGLELAETHMQLGRYEEGVELLAPLAERAGARYPEIWGALGLAHAHLGDAAAARAAIERALTLSPEDPRAVSAQELLGSRAP
ncbi:MAG: O-antigen ligase family protein [Actinomycetota bacterium]